MTYVALSRVKSLDGLNLIRPSKSSDIRFDDRIYKFQNTVELFNYIKREDFERVNDKSI